MFLTSLNPILNPPNQLSHIFPSYFFNLFFSFIFQIPTNQFDNNFDQKLMADTPETLKSRLYKLQSHNDEDQWVEQCEGYPVFKKEESIFKLKYYSLPSNDLYYEIVVNSNIRFDKNQNGVEWIQIKEGEIMAISFKQEFSANAFWTTIDDYQKKYEVSVPAATGTHFYFEYRVPDPNVNNLPLFLQEIQKIPEAQRHERLCSILLTKRQFLPRLNFVFQALQREEPKNLTKLELMFNIMKIIFNSANDQLLTQMMCNDLYSLLLGALQYDPNFRNHRPAHREFYSKHTRMVPVVPFKNQDLFNLAVGTYRLQYVRQCIMMPYLNDYSFTATAKVIRMNYKKILVNIFNPRKKDFINELFDHLRKQDQLAYRMLREMFRITKNIYASENLYLHIAERDFFQIMIKNMKDLREIDSGNVTEIQPQATNKYKRRVKPQDIRECVEIGLQILEQFMEYQPLHFKNFCVSETEKVSKYPTINFLLSYYEANKNCQSHSKLGNILKIIVTDRENHEIKPVLHTKVLEKFLQCSKDCRSLQKWIMIFNRTLLPISCLIDDKLEEILRILIEGLSSGSKQFQINILEGLNIIITAYIETEDGITKHLIPHMAQFINYLISQKGNMGIRLSIFLSIFKPKKFNKFVGAMIEELEKANDKLANNYLKYLREFLTREEVNLSSDLKREREVIVKDNECFENLEKKIKID